MRLLQPKFSGGDKAESLFTIAHVNDLLDELAATSEYSHDSICNKYSIPRRQKIDIIRELFRPLPPLEAAFMTHIILKDLQPILYPLPEAICSVSLLDYNTKSVKMLSKEHAIQLWDPSRYMQNLLRVKSSLDETATAFELPNYLRPLARPKIGSMIPLPKSVKGTGCRKALFHFQQSAMIWAETKYDGERAQIHVDILHDGSPKITIFSKSKRDSTDDRFGVHGIVLEALGFPTGGSSSRRSSRSHSCAVKIKKNIVLDAEMVAWSGDKIDEFWRINGLVNQTEFWRIDGLVNQTGTGARSKRRLRNTCNDSDSEDEEFNLSLLTDEPQSRHLALVFFDILVLDNQSLIFKPYAERRRLLETYIQPIYSRAMFSERHMIDMSEPDPSERLRRIFAEHLGNNQEGLVLKADESEYNDWCLPWVKLKADYIDGYGDCVDLMIAAAGWSRNRARELRVKPNVYTTFWVGAITNMKDIRARPNTKPHVLLFFTVSYGLNRQQLEDFNFRIRNSANIPYSAGTTRDHQDLPFTFSISPHLAGHKPQIIICIPSLVELLCAGFSKDRNSKHYEPRFPRITKIHGKQERPWTECMDITELNKIALQCIGKDRPSKDIDDWANTLWGKPTSPTVSQKRHAKVQDIEETLANLEGNLQHPKESAKRRKLGHVTNVPQIAVPNVAAKPQHEAKNTRQQFGHSDVNQYLNQHPSSAVVVDDPRMKTFPGVRAASRSAAAQSIGMAVSCFMRSYGNRNCESCLRWKKEVAKERRVHSLESLLVGCGVGGGLVSINQGHVFVHASDAAALESTVNKVREKGNDIKSQVLVFRCDTDRLVEEDASFVF
ncbi:DNA ligase 4 [Leucoagaricus sp. SymC.cos]|nr:DNA ligase 4 [Leucoagaricus sp. SymC.cos]